MKPLNDFIVVKHLYFTLIRACFIKQHQAMHICSLTIWGPKTPVGSTGGFSFSSSLPAVTKPLGAPGFEASQPKLCLHHSMVLFLCTYLYLFLLTEGLKPYCI